MRRIPYNQADSDKYIEACRNDPCFICQIVRGGALREKHHIIYENDDVIVFLSAYPTLYGHTLVCPKRHVEQVALEMGLDEYLRLQAVVHRVARSVGNVTNPERIYIGSFGSQQMNSHVHFHIVPLPENTPIHEQQMASMMPEIVGLLELEDEEWKQLAQAIRDDLD